MVTRWQRTRILTATLLAALMAGCGQPEEAEEGAIAPAADLTINPDTARSAEADAGTDGGVRAELEARGGTDIVGFALLAPRGAGTAVTVEIHGANSGWPYVAELVEGSCDRSGPVVATLGEITAGEGGDAEYHRVLDRSLVAPDGADRAVRVRGADDPAAVVACGDLGAASGTTSATGR